MACDGVGLGGCVAVMGAGWGALPATESRQACSSSRVESRELLEASGPAVCTAGNLANQDRPDRKLRITNQAHFKQSPACWMPASFWLVLSNFMDENLPLLGLRSHILSTHMSGSAVLMAGSCLCPARCLDCWMGADWIAPLATAVHAKQKAC